MILGSAGDRLGRPLVAPVGYRRLVCVSEHPTAGNPPRESSEEQQPGKTDQDKQQWSGDSDDPLDSRHEAPDALVPRPQETRSLRTWSRCGRWGLLPLAKRNSERSIGCLVVQDV